MWHSTVPTSSKKFVFDLPLFKYSDSLKFWRGEYFIVNYFTLLIFLKFIKKSIVLNWHIYWLCRKRYRLSCLEVLLRLVGIRLNHVLININIHPSSKIAFRYRYRKCIKCWISNQCSFWSVLFSQSTKKEISQTPQLLTGDGNFSWIEVLRRGEFFAHPVFRLR